MDDFEIHDERAVAPCQAGRRRYRAASVAGLLVVFAGTALLLVTRWQHSVDQRNLRAARALGLAQASAAAATADPMLALLLAREAWRTEPLPQVVAQLRTATRGSLERSWVGPRSAPGRGLAVFSAAGERVLTIRSGVARLHDSRGRQLAEFEHAFHRELIHAFVPFSPTGQHFLTVPSDDDETLRLWTADGLPLATLEGHDGRIWGAAFAPSGDRILTVGSGDGSVRVWSMAGEQIDTAAGAVFCAAFSPIGDLIAYTSQNEHPPGHLAEIGQHVEVERHGRFLAVRVQGWVRFSPDGRHLLLTPFGWSGFGPLFSPAMLVDLDGRVLARLHDDVCYAVFSPDGRLVATASGDRTARLWDLTGQPIAALMGHESWLWRVEFSSCGRRVVTASDDHTARIWGTDGRELAVLRGHDDEVITAVFSPLGDRVLTASKDGTFRIWATEPGEVPAPEDRLVELAGRRILREFSDEELRRYRGLLAR